MTFPHFLSVARMNEQHQPPGPIAYISDLLTVPPAQCATLAGPTASPAGTPARAGDASPRKEGGAIQSQPAYYCYNCSEWLSYKQYIEHSSDHIFGHLQSPASPLPPTGEAPVLSALEEVRERREARAEPPSPEPEQDTEPLPKCFFDLLAPCASSNNDDCEFFERCAEYKKKLEAPVSPAPNPDERVYIWSGQWKCYWEPDENGYTTERAKAGIYSRKRAEEILRGVGPEKELSIIPVPLEPSSPITQVWAGELVGYANAFYDGIISEQEFHKLASEIGERCGYFNLEGKTPTPVTVSDIVRMYLEQNGYDGLAGDDCGCYLKDLFCCGSICFECVPGVRGKNEDGDDIIVPRESKGQPCPLCKSIVAGVPIPTLCKNCTDIASQEG